MSMIEVATGETRELQLVDDLTRTQIVVYAGVSGDYNPLHSDEKYSREVAGYPGVFAPRHVDDGHDGSGRDRLVRFRPHHGVRSPFVRQVWPGDTLVARATVARLWGEDGARFAEVTIETVNQEDVTVMSGTATARLDP